MPTTKVTIGIQARVGSTRLPGKVFETLGSRSILRLVIDSCFKAAMYINNWGTKNLSVDLALCVPYGDPIKMRFSDELPVIEGPENDVLLRYLLLVERNKPDYIVRITADCPLIPPFIISKCITTAVMNSYDYLSNVDERCRTSADGMDCEVISRKLMEYVGSHATDPKDREHVTTFIRSNPPPWIKQGIIVNFLDLSHMKLSVDTQEDLERVRKEYDKIQSTYQKAQEIFGRNNVHRF